MEERKNLATCKPSEFLVQTGKIRKAVQGWLDATKVLEIRKEKPVLMMVTRDMTPEEVADVQKKNKELMQEQSKKNLSKILDSILEEHPQETLELLALLCFVEPKDVDNHSVAYYLGCIADILNDGDVMSFFISLAQLEQIDTFKG